MNRGAFLAAGGAFAAFFDLARPARCAEDDELGVRIRKIAKNFPGAIGVYARTLAPGDPIAAYRAYESFPTASTIKVLIMTTAFSLEEAQPGTLEQEIPFDRSELIAGSDFMSDAADGQRFTVRELITPMIRVSDNTAANMLIEHFGVDTINGVGTDAGLAQTHLQRKFLDWYAIVRHSQNVSTPADMARLLYLIESGAHEGTRTIVSAPYCRTMVNIMLGQTDRDAIPAALPVGTPIANKTGEIDGTRDDVAIVDPYGTSPLILTVMTKAAYDYAASYAAIHAIARDVYAAAR
ncbi:MAG: serine hydrolase [Candidatus Eremiobacteraeota bacterium]|nr:serine hydrolase [Candidatus Eremiobacteraeota bacterium]